MENLGFDFGPPETEAEAPAPEGFEWKESPSVCILYRSSDMKPVVQIEQREDRCWYIKGASLGWISSEEAMRDVEAMARKGRFA